MLAVLCAWQGLTQLAWAQTGDYRMNAVTHFTQFYPPDKWFPVRVTLENHTGQAVDGYAIMPIQNDAGGVITRLPVQVPPRSRVAVMTYGYFPEEIPATEDQRNRGIVPPATIVQWQRATGGQLGRNEILARPLVPAASRRTADLPTGIAGTLILAVAPPHMVDARQSFDIAELIQFLEPIFQRPMTAAVHTPDAMPRQVVGLDSASVIVLPDIHPDQLDQAHRDALIAFVTAGGTLIVANPGIEADFTDSWIAPYMPVQMVGVRQQDAIHAVGNLGQNGPLPMRELVPVTEALDTGGTVLLAEEHYVHVAYTRLGLGRIMFLSFPINALDPEDPRMHELWSQILDVQSGPLEWRETRLAEERDLVLQSMIGMPVAPWSLAAAIVGIYLLLIAGVQFAVGGARRPAAFMVVTVAAVVLSAALVAMGMFQRRDYELAGARLSLIELGPGGGGVQQEILAWSGRDVDDFVLTSATDQVALRPLIASAANVPVIDVDTFTVRRGIVHQARIERVWQAQGTLPQDMRLTAAGVFNAQGLQLSVNNELGQRLEAPVLVWQRRAVPLDDVPTAQVTQQVTRGPNPPGDFANATIFSPESAKLRGDIIQASLLPPSDRMQLREPDIAPMLVGWLDETAPRLVETPTDPQVPLRTQAMVRVPLRIEPSPVGSRIRIPDAFTRIAIGEVRGLPYDAQRGEWLPTQQGGSWLLAMAIPAEIGQVRTTRVTLQVNLSAPQQTITLRRGQVQDGQVQLNPQGPVIATWRQPIGTESVTIDLGPQDIDENGWLWMNLNVEAPVAMATPSQWHIREFSAAYEAEVVGPPRQ